MREMKDSGIDWIGEIPRDWNLTKAKYVFKQRNEKGNKISLRLLSPTQRFGVIPQDEYEELTGMKAVKLNEKTDYSLLKTIHKGDFCISLRSFQGGFEYSEYEGVVSPAYQVFFSYIPVECRFFKYIFKDQGFIEMMNSFTLSLRDGKNIAFDDFGNSYIPIPSFYEQSQIADFLDRKCSEIDALTKDILTQIEILEEYKKSVITEAVTKGLDPNVEMKDSGIQWVDKIPANWKVNKIKYISNSIFKGQGIKKENVDINGDIQCVRYGEIYSKYSNSFYQCFSFVNSNNLSRKQPFIKNGDIIFAITGELIEEIGKNVLYTGELDCAVGGDIVVVRIDEDRRFVNYALNSSYCQNQKSCNKFKLKVVHISAFEIGNILVLIPPLNIQKAISDFLDLKCAEIDTTISEKRQQLETLAEYKKSLVYEYVTGKKEIA